MKNIKSDLDKPITIEHAIKLLIDHSSKSFIESIDICLHLGIDPKRTDQNVKGFACLPYGTGNDKKVIVFTDNFTINDIPDAYKVGGKTLIESIAASKSIDFDAVAASPDIMDQVSILSSKLGPKGLMPSAKTGTLSMNVDKIVKDVRKNIVTFKNDPVGIIHTSVGKCNFDILHIIENIKAVLIAVKDVKPAGSKGIFMKKLYISSTMGRSFLIPLNQFIL